MIQNSDQMLMPFVDDRRYIIVLPTEGDAHAEPFNEDTIASRTSEILGGVTELATTVEIPPCKTFAEDGYVVDAYVRVGNTDEFIRNQSVGRKNAYTSRQTALDLCENKRLTSLGDGRCFYGNAVLCGYDGDRDIGITRQHVDILLEKFNNADAMKKFLNINN